MKYTSLAEVAEEMERQVAKWGEQNHSDFTPDGLFDYPEAVVSADNAKLFCDSKAERGTVSWNDIFVEEVLETVEEAEQGNEAKLREELIQVAAVACSWVNAIDRRNKA